MEDNAWPAPPGLEAASDPVVDEDVEPVTEEDAPVEEVEDLTDVAKRVLAGEFGIGQAARQALADAGYDHNKVKKEIVRLLNESP